MYLGERRDMRGATLGWTEPHYDDAGWLPAEARMFADESRGGRGGFIPAETLVQNDTAGDNGTGSGTIKCQN